MMRAERAGIHGNPESGNHGGTVTLKKKFSGDTYQPRYLPNSHCSTEGQEEWEQKQSTSERAKQTARQTMLERKSRKPLQKPPDYATYAHGHCKAPLTAIYSSLT